MAGRAGGGFTPPQPPWDIWANVNGGEARPPRLRGENAPVERFQRRTPGAQATGRGVGKGRDGLRRWGRGADRWWVNLRLREEPHALWSLLVRVGPIVQASYKCASPQAPYTLRSSLIPFALSYQRNHLRKLRRGECVSCAHARSNIRKMIPF